MSNNPGPAPRPAHAGPHRLLLTILAVLSLAVAWMSMWRISAHDPWYRNTNMNIHNLADALSLNSGYAPGVVDQPGTVPKFLLALDYRVRNEFGLLPVWTLKRFARSPEPLHELARLVQVGREHSRGLVILFILVTAGFVGQVTRRFDFACFTVVLLCGSSGLLFHGLLTRPELLCAGFGGVLALQCAWLASAATRSTARTLWLLLAGVCTGLALLSKLPAWFYLMILAPWCCIVPLLPPALGAGTPATPVHRGWTIAACITAGLATLGLLFVLSRSHALLDPVAAARLRAVAAAVALLPILVLAGVRGPVARYLVGRLLDLTLLLAGVIAVCTGWFGLLRTTLPSGAAADATTKILNTVFHPDPLVHLYTHPGEGRRGREVLRFVMETPALFLTTCVLAVGLVFFRSAPARHRALVLFLLVQGLGMTALMSQREFLAQYSLFAQVPLLLAWAFGLAALHEWWLRRAPASEQRWPVALATAAAFILVLTAPMDLRSKYNGYQEDSALPVNELTVTYLYDHDAHPAAYLAALKARYPTRNDFIAELNLFLANPANRTPDAP